MQILYNQAKEDYDNGNISAAADKVIVLNFYMPIPTTNETIVDELNKSVGEELLEMYGHFQIIHYKGLITIITDDGAKTETTLSNKTKDMIVDYCAKNSKSFASFRVLLAFAFVDVLKTFITKNSEDKSHETI